jgi:hypothetical protein
MTFATWCPLSLQEGYRHLHDRPVLIKGAFSRRPIHCLSLFLLSEYGIQPILAIRQYSTGLSPDFTI